MNNGTHNPATAGPEPMTSSTPGQTTCPDWCDVPPGHTGEHDGEADFPKITATADREAFMTDDAGVLVPEVIARLIGHDEPTNVYPRMRVALSVVHPRDGYYSSASCSLTLDEAALLRKHLTALLREVGQEVAW